MRATFGFPSVLAISFLGLLVITCLGCPSPPTPEELVRETFRTGLEYVKAGQYDKVWTLYSPEFRRVVSEGYRKQQVTVRGEMDKNSDWIQEWVYRQFKVEPAELLKLTPEEMDARAMMANRDLILGQKIVGNVLVEGEKAEAKILQPGSDSPARMEFILHNGRWLFHRRDFMPVK